MSPNSNVREITIKVEPRPDMANDVQILALIKDSRGSMWMWPKEGVFVSEREQQDGLGVFLHSLAKHLEKK